MLQKIKKYVENLDEEALHFLDNISTTKTYKKGELLLRAGQICQNNYIIESGIARKYYNIDEKQITTELYFENDVAIAFDSYTLQQASRETIEALTDTKVSVINYRNFQEAKLKYASLLTLDLLFVEHYAMWFEQRLFEFHTMNATQRYLQLMDKSPHIIQNVSVTIIASYLGISLETLSRIRARI